jgi:hypothetical protein
MRLSEINGVNQSCRLETCFRLPGHLIAMVMVIGIAYPQDRGVDPQAPIGKPGDIDKDKSDADGKRRRLETVTWNPTTCELTWVVSEGNTSAGAYLPLARETYLVHVDAAVMQFNGEGRRFSQEEAQHVHTFMDILSQYAIGSTIWWELGQGEKVEEQKNPSPPSEKNKTPPDPANLRERHVRLGRPADALLESKVSP